MKTIFKLISASAFIVAASCTKESIKTQSASANNQSSSTQVTYYIGKSYGGGIIFYLDSTKQHGLIAAVADQSTSKQWYDGAYTNTGARGTAIGTGRENTRKIIQAFGTGSYAAKVCRSYRGGGFTDWYLPSRDELNKLYLQRNKVGGFSATNYWSSSEYNANTAYDQEFGGGYKFKDDKSFTIHVRAIRSF